MLAVENSTRVHTDCGMIGSGRRPSSEVHSE